MHRMLNITRDTGEFLGVLVRAATARRVLEIGTSNGYSTLWRPGGVLMVDNATSNREEIAPFVGSVNGDRDFAACLVPVGKGEYVAVKALEVGN
jgi:hypothetical protein